MAEDEFGKMFVGGLSWETTQEHLSQYFCRFGEIIDCVVMKNNESGRSRGFGFVTFADPSNVNRVLESGPHSLDGRTIDPKACNPRTQQLPKKNGAGYKVFLGGLLSNVTETELRTFFGRYGKVTEVVIMYDQEKKKSRGFGFLSFEDESSVEQVTNERYINLNGKQVEIKKAEPRDGSSGGQNGGNNGSSGGGGSYGKPNNEWGSHHAPNNMMQGQHGQMGGPPPNMNNMMTGYQQQGWGTSPQPQGYGYGNSGPGAYQEWGASPGPQAAPQQWSNYGGPQQQQTQAYGGYDMYNATSPGGGPSGPTGGGGNWNSWPNSAGPTGAPGAAGGGTATDMYSHAQTWPAGGQPNTGPVGGGMARSGPGNSASKSGGEYEYGGGGGGGYGTGNEYDYRNYGKPDGGASNYGGGGQRSGYANDSSTQPPA